MSTPAIFLQEIISAIAQETFTRRTPIPEVSTDGVNDVAYVRHVRHVRHVR